MKGYHQHRQEGVATNHHADRLLHPVAAEVKTSAAPAPNTMKLAARGKQASLNPSNPLSTLQ